MKACIFGKHGFFGGGLLCVMIATGSFFSGAEAASPIFVDSTGDDASIDPRDSNSPVLTLRRAIEIANPRDVIHVGSGIFTETPLTVRIPLTIEGNGAADTIISNAGGPSAGSVITIESGSPASAPRVDLTGLTLRDGNSDKGGGLNNNGGNVVLRGVTITGNSASQEGGGLWNSDAGTLHVQRCEIKGNQCGSDAPGGGLFNNGGTVTISNSTISGNHAGDGSTTSNYSGANGGGIANFGALTIVNTTIFGNAAGNGVSDNFNIGGGGNGGGIFNQGSVILLNSTLSGNCAGNAADPMVLVGNAFGGSGGAIDTTGSAGTVTIDFCTIADNKAGLSISGDGYGGGCHANDFIDKIFISNCIIANNTVGATGSGADVAGAVVSNGHNIIGDQGFFRVSSVLRELVTCWVLILCSERFRTTVAPITPTHLRQPARRWMPGTRPLSSSPISDWRHGMLLQI